MALATGLVLAALPYAGASPFTITLLTEGLIFGIWAMSLDLLVGYAGLVSFGHAAAFGLAGYAAGYFARQVTGEFFVAFLVAEAVTLTVALAMGVVVARVSGIAFAVISLCIAQVLFTVAVVWRDVTNGMDGMVGVPLPKILGFTLSTGNAFYLLTVGCLIAVYLALARVTDSPFGRTLHAIRTNEERAASIGIDVRLHKLIAFLLSWAVAALAGTLMVFLKAGTTPMSLHWTESGNVLMMNILGGIGTLFGPVIGSTVFVFVGSGIGRACAVALGKRGYAVAAFDIDEASARETASQIPGARAYRADVSVGAQVDAAISAAVADNSPLEVLVNNAGILD
jgi:branched-chain amino acid transport system permease protein